MNFRNFIDQLKTTGKLIEITDLVSPVFEAPGIAKEKGAPVLFYNVNGYQTVMNLLGSQDELAAMLGVPKDKIIERLAGVSYRQGTHTSFTKVQPQKVSHCTWC